MLKAVHIKILVAILAVLVAVAAELVHIHKAAQRSAAILQQQQDDTDAAKRHDEETREFIRKQHQKNNAYSVNGSQTMDHYIP